MKKQKNTGNFYSGISGLVLPIPKYKFPEQFQNSTRLTYYSSLLNSIEINRSFYALPKEKTLAKWSGEVPANFRFTFKLWKQITHEKNLNFKEQDVTSFLQAINHVGEKKGCLLIQLPPSVTIEHTKQVERLLKTIQNINSADQWKIAVEFRNASLYNNDISDLITAHDATVVIHDKSRAASSHSTTTSSIIYLRFHGPNGDYRGTYDKGFLSEYATYIRDWLSEGKSVFAYFNNTMGSAFGNLKTLNKFVISCF